MKAISRFLADDSGATAIEYALIASLIALAIITGAGAIGTNLSTKFTKISSEVGK